MKRFVKNIFVATFAVVFLFVLAVGCSGNSCKEQTESGKSKITLSANKISLDVFDDYELKCITENIADDIVWISSAEEVVSIDVESVTTVILTAKSEGTAKITAKAGDISAICEVEVSATSFSPVLYVGESKTVNMYPDGSFKIPVSLTYKGKVVDADFSFRSQAEDIVSVSDDGVITAKQEGEAIIDITANFKGNSFADNVFVIVKSGVAALITIDGEPLNNNTVYVEVKDTAKLKVNTLFNGKLDEEIFTEWFTQSALIGTVISENEITINAVNAGFATLKLVLTKGDFSNEYNLLISILKKPINCSEELIIDKSAVVDGQCTVILPAGVDATKIESISDGVVNKPITSVNTLTNAITFDVSDIMSGKRELKVESDNYIYAFANSIIADMVIKTVDNLDKFGETLKADATTANSYYILGADIDYGGANWSAGWYGSTAKFRGTFDGRGYAVRNYVAHLGLFGELVAESIVKDLYVYAQLKGNANGGSICNLNSGVIENCMVILTVLSGETSVNFAGVAAGNNTSGEIRNCIVKVAAYNGEEKSFNAIVGANSGTISHCFAVSDYSTYLYGEETEGLYASEEEFLADITGLSSENGWSEYWSIEDNKWYFGGKKIYVIKNNVNVDTEIIINKAAAIDKQCSVILPLSIDATKVESVSDGIVIIPVSSVNAAENSVSFDISLIKSGRQELKFESDNYIYAFANAIVADMVITTVAELNAFGETMKADETTINSYYILGADIDYGGANWSAGWYGSTARFRGTFDGRGHAITNYVMHYGLFCDMVVGSEVKDLYVSAKLKGSANGSALSRSNNGHIENCMVLLTVMSGEVGVNFSGIASGNNVSGVINNCIVKVVAYAGQEKTFNTIAELNSGVISDCYAVSTYSTYLYGEETEGLYASDEEFLAEITELSSEDGWSAYWSIEDNKWYFSDKKIYVPKTVIDIESEIIINTGASEEYTLTLPEEIDAAEVVSVSDEAVIKEIISANVEDNTITFVVAGLTTGKKEIYIETEEIRYVMKNAIVADMVITTVAELNAFGEAMKADETTINSYYILGADIDYGGANWSAGWYGSTARFRGTFDGRGHAITNYVMHYGLFCDMVVGSEVKDLYVSAKLKGSANGSALSRSNNGHIENCMVLLTVMSGEVGVNFSGIASGNNVSGVINNCIVKVVAYAGQEKTFNAIAELNSGVISDCYAVSTYSAYLYDEETEGLYASDEEFLAEITELSSEDGWSAYWSIEDNKWYFSDKKIYVIKTTVSDDTEILINRATVAEDNKYTVILPVQVDVTEIESVSDGSITIPIISADAENNSVTFDLTQIQSGEKELIFESVNCVYRFVNSLIVDMVITTVEEFNTFGEIVKADGTTANSYYILGADIDYGGEYWSAGCNGHNTKFRGTLDGHGFAIKNFKAQRGLFGDMIEGSVVKNMYLDVKLDGDWQGGAVCWWNYGRIENCAIVLNITKGDGTYFGGVVHSNYAAGVISNCIVNIESYTGNDKGRKFNAISDSGSGIPTNCYAVSPYSSAMYGSVATGLYANEETFFAEITVLPVENGWSGYWSIEDGVLYFGGTVVLGQS